jgi:putative ABC transport system permease protein
VFVASVVASTVAYYVIDAWLSGFRYRVDISFMVFLLSASMALAVAFLTVALQSYKTASPNPGIALRYER